MWGSFYAEKVPALFGWTGLNYLYKRNNLAHYRERKTRSKVCTQSFVNMNEQMEPTPALLDSSPLGTKEYWNNVYSEDLLTHADTPEHIGQIWFDESNAEDRTIAFLEGKEELAIDPSTATVLDLGTGNASMLIRLREEGWKGSLWGIDYSDVSVRLARRIVGRWGHEQVFREEPEDKDNYQGIGGKKMQLDEFDQCEEPTTGIHLIQHDILTDWPPKDALGIRPPQQFDLVLDKGTFDAISLSTEAATACPLYRSQVTKLIKPGGVLLITSCNWTEQELEKWITGGGQNGLHLVGRVTYSRFKFGGHEGRTLTGLCWQRG